MKITLHEAITNTLIIQNFSIIWLCLLYIYELANLVWNIQQPHKWEPIIFATIIVSLVMGINSHSMPEV